jgi:lysozyme
MKKTPLQQSIADHEGFSPAVYTCPAGHPTIGYGYNLAAGMTPAEGLLLMQARLAAIEGELQYSFDWFDGLARLRKDVLVEMGYQMGLDGLYQFKKTLRLVGAGMYDQAATEMLDSAWAAQTPGRAENLAAKMRAGCTKKEG